MLHMQIADITTNLHDEIGNPDVFDAARDLLEENGCDVYRAVNGESMQDDYWEVDKDQLAAVIAKIKDGTAWWPDLSVEECEDFFTHDAILAWLEKLHKSSPTRSVATIMFA